MKPVIIEVSNVANVSAKDIQQDDVEKAGNPARHEVIMISIVCVTITTHIMKHVHDRGLYLRLIG